jgi:hypothetical protein
LREKKACDRAALGSSVLQSMNWISILSAGVCGGAGGGLGALLARALGFGPFGSGAKSDAARERLARLAPPKGTSPGQVLALIPALIGAALGSQVVGPMATDAWADARARTPAEKFERATEKNLLSSPELKAWARTMEARGLSVEQANIESRKLGASGVARLSDTELLARARILGRGAQLLDAGTCAKFARGAAGGPELTKLLDTVGESDAQELATIASHAMLAELRRLPAARPATTKEDVDKIFETVATLSGDHAVTKVRRVFAEGADDDEMCSGARVLYDALPRVDPPTQQRLAMLLAGL